MTTMVERVARAICTASQIDPDRKGNETEWRWQEFEKEARAAIEAMREPSEAMENAAFENMKRNGYEQGNPASDYTAMIDAALNEEVMQ